MFYTSPQWRSSAVLTARTVRTVGTFSTTASVQSDPSAGTASLAAGMQVFHETSKTLTSHNASCWTLLRPAELKRFTICRNLCFLQITFMFSFCFDLSISNSNLALYRFSLNRKCALNHMRPDNRHDMRSFLKFTTLCQYRYSIENFSFSRYLIVFDIILTVTFINVFLWIKLISSLAFHGT